MIVTRMDDPLPSLMSEADAGGESLARSPGLHLSDIYRDIEREIAPKNEWADERQLRLYGEVGFLWERVFSNAYRDAVVDGGEGDYVRPGEFEADGIIGSPDLIRMSDWTVIETKAAWKSVRKWDEDLEKNFWLWLVQVKGYCRLIGTDVAEIHPIFINGNYKPPMPTKRGVRLEFSTREIEGNWTMLKEHAQRKGWL